MRKKSSGRKKSSRKMVSTKRVSKKKSKTRRTRRSTVKKGRKRKRTKKRMRGGAAEAPAAEAPVAEAPVAAQDGWRGQWSETMGLPGLQELATSSGIKLEVLDNQTKLAWDRDLPLYAGDIVKTPSGMGHFFGKGRMDKQGNLQVQIGDDFFSFDQISTPTPQERQSYLATSVYKW